MNNPLLAFAFVLLAARGFAQAPAPSFFTAPPAGSAWEVKIISESGDPALAKPVEEGTGNPPEPVLLSVKHGLNGVVEGTISYSDGTRRSYYASGGFILQKAVNTNGAVLIPADETGRDPFSLQVTTFPGLGWLAQSNFKGREMRSDTECFHFGFIPLHGEPPEPGPPLQAWIRASDRKPLEAAAGGRRYFYSEIVPFEADISLPAGFAAALAQRKEERASIERIRQINARYKARRDN